MSDASINLDDRTIDRLNDLIRINIDSHKGFTEAAEIVDDPQLKRRFLDYAQQRLANAEELKQYVPWQEEDVEDRGSAAATAHRWWLNLRSKLTTGDPAGVVLSEAERGEDTIKHQYEEALHNTTGTPIVELVRRQYAYVRAGHDEVRSLRDSRLHGR